MSSLFPARTLRRRRLLSALALALLAILSGVALFWTAQRVQMGETQLRHLQASSADEAEATRVLRAEWAYLNRPDRLENLARTQLGMGPAHAGAVATPGAPLSPPPAPASAPQKRTLVHTEALKPPAPLAPAAEPKSFHDLVNSLSHESGKGPP